MPILLIRHAEAVAEAPGIDDAARWLTERGRAQARDVAEQVRARGLNLVRVCASPRVRAVQTAELLVQGLSFEGLVEVVAALSFTSSAERAAKELTALEQSTEGVLTAVGHMPTLSQTAHLLTDGTFHEGIPLCGTLLIEGRRVVWSAAPR